MANRNYRRFYGLLRQLPGADKETLVMQYTRGRTRRLHETSVCEYNAMCEAMERLSGLKERMETMREELRRRRSACLNLMQRLGVNTADWAAVDNLCRNPRIAGKPFAQIGIDELETLRVKLLMIKKHGGLDRRVSPVQGKPSYIYVPMWTIAES